MMFFTKEGYTWRTLSATSVSRFDKRIGAMLELMTAGMRSVLVVVVIDGNSVNSVLSWGASSSSFARCKTICLSLSGSDQKCQQVWLKTFVCVKSLMSSSTPSLGRLKTAVCFIPPNNEML
eukprot:TRINITY_DN78755_c0_g1_i1.p1 TRINITY_DN78755_c0_g1~~TRINITY_DN78755_c0_g1_i1.p1  ORF type:complete len:121 (+),score=1.81 TRINITY_DN78755_c0_g1_i1:368-730(+)